MFSLYPPDCSVYLWTFKKKKRTVICISLGFFLLTGNKKWCNDSLMKMTWNTQVPPSSHEPLWSQLLYDERRGQCSLAASRVSNCLLSFNREKQRMVRTWLVLSGHWCQCQHLTCGKEAQLSPRCEHNTVDRILPLSFWIDFNWEQSEKCRLHF